MPCCKRHTVSSIGGGERFCFAYDILLIMFIIGFPLAMSVEPHTWLPIKNVESNHTTLRSINLYGSCLRYKIAPTNALEFHREDFSINSCPKPSLETYANANQKAFGGEDSKILLLRFDEGTTSEEASAWTFQIEYTSGVHMYDVVYPNDGNITVQDFAKEDKAYYQRRNKNSAGQHQHSPDDLGDMANIVDEAPPFMVPPYGQPKYLAGLCTGTKTKTRKCPGFTVTIASLSKASSTSSAATALEDKPCQTVGYALISNILPTRGMPTAPNYFVASRTRSVDEITLCTQLSADRMYKLRQLASDWEGSISATIFVREHAIEVPYITKFWLSYPELNGRVDIHLVFNDERPPFDIPEVLPKGNSRLAYPINYLRNVAILHARTRWVLLVEGDMTVSPHSYNRMQRHISEGHFVSAGSAQGNGKKVGYIVPLFYTTKEFQEMDRMPTTKAEVRDSNKFEYCPYASHRFLSKFMKDWYASDIDSSPIPIEALQGQEPYFVAEREVLPMFDENYYCTGDKVQQVTKCRTCAGFQFELVPDLFLINFEPFYSEETRDDRVFPKPQLCSWYLQQKQFQTNILSLGSMHQQLTFGAAAIGVESAGETIPILEKSTGGDKAMGSMDEKLKPPLELLLLRWILLIVLLVYIRSSDEIKRAILKARNLILMKTFKTK